jgi:hypothetical protein
LNFPAGEVFVDQNFQQTSSLLLRSYEVASWKLRPTGSSAGAAAAGGSVVGSPSRRSRLIRSVTASASGISLQFFGGVPASTRLATSYTGMRVPRMTGAPRSISGSSMTNSCACLSWLCGLRTHNPKVAGLNPIHCNSSIAKRIERGSPPFRQRKIGQRTWGR